MKNKRRLLVPFATSIVLACSGGPSGGGVAEIDSVSPEEGTNAGGTTVTIVGSGFRTGPASVYFGSQPATDVVVVSDTEIQCVSPAHAMPPVDALPVDVEVRSGGNVGLKSLGYQFVNAVEFEPQAEKGFNDTFPSYVRVPIDADYTGYIGAQDDVDVLHLHTPANGRVLISIQWTASYTSGGIAGIQAEYFHGPDPSPNPEGYFGGQISVTGDPALPGTPEIQDWLRMAYVTDGHGPFLRLRGIGSGTTHAGYDPVNAYTLHATFIPDETTEPDHADGFHFAKTLGTGLLMNTANYDQDYDWYRFSLAGDGWARVVLDAGDLGADDLAEEVLLGARLFVQDPSDENLVTGVPSAQITIGDRPSSWGAVLEANGLAGGHDYLLRLHNVNYPGGPTSSFEHPVSVEYGLGDIEDAEPSQLGPAETEYDANALTFNLLSASAEGYVFHYADRDWFKFTAESATATIVWNLTDVRASIGDYDATANPFGGRWGMMVFDQAWFDSAGHQVVTNQALANDYMQGTDTRAVSVVTTIGQDYYVLLDALRGYDLTTPYTLTVDGN